MCFSVVCPYDPPTSYDFETLATGAHYEYCEHFVPLVWPLYGAHCSLTTYPFSAKNAWKCGHPPSQPSVI